MIDDRISPWRYCKAFWFGIFEHRKINAWSDYHDHRLVNTYYRGRSLIRTLTRWARK